MSKRTRMPKVTTPPLPPPPPPPPPTKAEQLKSFVEYLDSRIKYVTGKLKVWREAVNAETSPALFLERLTNDLVFEGAAQVMVWTVARDALTKEDSKATLATLAEYAKEQTFRFAKYPRASTSRTSNMAHLYTGAAWADLAEDAATWARAATSPDACPDAWHASAEGIGPCPSCAGTL